MPNGPRCRVSTRRMMMLKATLIEAQTARMLDETPCMVTEAVAMVENGKVVGVRATLRLARPLTVVRDSALVITGDDEKFEAGVPVLGQPIVQPPKPQEPAKP